MNKIEIPIYHYGNHNFNSKEKVMKFLKNNGHTKSWIIGYLLSNTEIRDIKKATELYERKIICDYCKETGESNDE
tara:strand:+ start:354 stop:578 length:225 start_codon:yes stop_codon:yes gene_type:complete